MAKKKSEANNSVGVDSVARSSTPIFIAIGVVVVAAIIAALIWAMNQEDTSGPNTEVAEFQTVKVEGTPLAAYQADGADQTVGNPAPEARGKSFDGSEVNIVSDGRAKVIGFMAHWCPHCQNELPVYSSFIKNVGDQYEADYLAVATGSSATRANYPPSKWFEKESFAGKVLTDDRSSTVGSAFGINSYPYFVVLDKDHKVVARTTGELTETQLTDFVKAATGAAPAPTTVPAPAPESPTPAPGPSADGGASDRAIPQPAPAG